MKVFCNRDRNPYGLPKNTALWRSGSTGIWTEGYFLFSYPGSQAGTQGKAASSAAPNLFVEIVDTKAQPVHLSATALQLTPGIAMYQNITIPTGTQAIGDPPEAIRKVAMPSQKVQSKSKRTKTS